MDIFAKIKGIKYKPFLCRTLEVFGYKDLESALSSYASFILKINKENTVAISWWVSAKRTRSYPYARVYDTLDYSGKKITIIPVIKDEGKDGDRDFLQWDTVSLMSLLGVYVIIAYYSDAVQSSRYDKKITEQRFDTDYLRNQINRLLSYQSDALHWNLSQIDDIAEISKKALDSYERISRKLRVGMHSRDSAEKRISELKKGKDTFMKLSRNLAEMAQKRESITIQPKEHLDGIKGTITITNYLGGYYYLTVDEAKLLKNSICLIEGKHSKGSTIPSTEDIKDGLIKMILFTNLKEVKIGDKEYIPISVLKLTSNIGFSIEKLSSSRIEMLRLLSKESAVNKFEVLLNGKKIQDYQPLRTL